MIGSKLLDSSIWLAHLFYNSHTDIIDKEEKYFISALSIFEIKTKLLKKEVPLSEIKEKIAFIKQKSIVLDLTEEIAEKAADISVEKNLPAIDSLIYQTAISHNCQLLTMDNDFRNLKNAVILS